MARIYLSKEDSPIADFAKTYLDERNKKRQFDLTKSNAAFEQDMRFGELGGRIKPKRIDGIYSGYEALPADSAESRSINQKLEKSMPGSTKITTDYGAPAKPPEPAVSALGQKEAVGAPPIDAATTKAISDMIEAEALKAGKAAPPGSVVSGLTGLDKLKSLTAAPAMPTSTQAAPAAPQSMGPAPLLASPQAQAGANLKIAPTRQSVSFGDAIVSGGLPERPRQEAPTADNPWLQSLQLKQALAIKPEEMIDPRELPFEVAAELGLVTKDGKVFDRPIPKFVLEERLKRSGISGGLDPVAAKLADEVRSGKRMLGEALVSYEMLTGKKPGKDVVNIISGQSREAAIEGRQKKGLDYRDKATVRASLAQLKNDFDSQAKTIRESYFAANTLLSLANEPNTQGFDRALQTMAAKATGEVGVITERDVSTYGNMDGWSEKMQQLYSSITNRGYTPENREALVRLATALKTAQRNKLIAMRKDAVLSAKEELADYGVSQERIENALNIDNILKSGDSTFELPPKTIGTTNPDPRNPSGKNITNQEARRRQKAEADRIRSQNRKNFKPTNPELQLKAEMENMNKALKQLEAAKIPADRKATIKRQIQEDFYNRTKKLDPEGKGVRATRPDGSDVP